MRDGSKIYRRSILKIIGIIGLGAFLYNTSIMIELLQRIRVRYLPMKKLPSESEKKIVKLPNRGNDISVETALNSRCTSDYDGYPKVFHWGLFDRAKKIDADQVKMVCDFAKAPRFTKFQLETKIDNNIITVVSEKSPKGNGREWLAVESGMLQQAICLVCSALGIGMVFKAHGGEEPYIHKNLEANIRLKLDAMKPSYDGLFWSELPPSGRKPWLKGNLPDPVRKGSQPFLQILKDLGTQNNGKTKINDKYISQVLWSARGRTPHYYNSKPWGMTIPTNKGAQNNSSVILVSDNKAFEYINWKSNRPTHEIKLMASASGQNIGKIIETFHPFNTCIILKRSKQKISVTWEIGYQLLNAMLQSMALNISYKAVLLDHTTKQLFKEAGINDAVAAVLY